MTESDFSKKHSGFAAGSGVVIGTASSVPAMEPIVRCAEPAFASPTAREAWPHRSFLEKVWRRLIEMGRNVQKDVEKKN